MLLLYSQFFNRGIPPAHHTIRDRLDQRAMPFFSSPGRCTSRGSGQSVQRRKIGDKAGM